jgi:GTP diphosphokinase / guanosine-3',5'-bis(diphosphate) 3'-diphosphatase
MIESGKIFRAASFAAEKHSNQRRKGARAEPYINHPIEVANLLVNVGKIDDADVIAAGLLHDTVEDCGVSFEEIGERFGHAVADYIRELTDDKSLPKAERKRLQVEHAPQLSHGAKQVKLADKISNIRDITISPPADWSLERRREYVDWGWNVVAGLRGANAELEKLFDETVEAAMKEIGQAGDPPSTQTSPSA